MRCQRMGTRQELANLTILGVEPRASAGMLTLSDFIVVCFKKDWRSCWRIFFRSSFIMCVILGINGDVVLCWWVCFVVMFVGHIRSLGLAVCRLSDFVIFFCGLWCIYIPYFIFIFFPGVFMCVREVIIKLIAILVVVISSMTVVH